MSSEKVLPAKSTKKGQVYVSPHGINVVVENKLENGWPLVTLVDFLDVPHSIAVPPTYPLRELNGSIAKTFRHRSDTKIGCVVSMLFAAVDNGVSVKSLVKGILEKGLAKNQSEQAVEKDLIQCISDLRLEGHQIVRVGDAYFHRGMKE